MAQLHRRKSFSVISRYCLNGHFSSLSHDSASSVAGISRLPSPSSSSTLIQSPRQLFSTMAVATQTSLCQSPRSYTTTTTCLGNKHATSYFYTHTCTSDCGCLCTSPGVLRILARNCTTTAYPPPVPPGEFQGGDVEAEADGAPLNVDEAESNFMEGEEDINMPPYDDSNFPEDDEGPEEKELPPDPEEKLLYSPSDED